MVRVGLVLSATIGGMAFGGWFSGEIFDLTLSYEAAFLNGFIWNVFNLLIVALVLWRSKKSIQPVIKRMTISIPLVGRWPGPLN